MRCFSRSIPIRASRMRCSSRRLTRADPEDHPFAALKALQDSMQSRPGAKKPKGSAEARAERGRCSSRIPVDSGSGTGAKFELTH